MPIQAQRETLLSETLIQARQEELQSKHADPSTNTRRSISANPPQASICQKHRSKSADPPQAPIHSLCLCWCVYVLVCLVLWCLWLIFDYVSVEVCVSEEEADNEGIGFEDGEEREKKDKRN